VKKSKFIASVHEDYAAFIDIATDEDIGKFIRAQICANRGDDIPVLEGLSKALFDTHISLIARVEANSEFKSEIGKLGGAPKGNQNARKQPKAIHDVDKNNQKQAEVDYKTTQNKPDTDTDTNTDKKIKESLSTDTADGGAAGAEISVAENPKIKPVYARNSKHYKAAAWLQEQVINNSPRALPEKSESAREAQLQKWAQTFRLMETSDKLAWEDIREVLMWATSDEFWRMQILSADNFRKKYTQLAIKMGGGTVQDNIPDGISGYKTAAEIISEGVGYG
jgi:hypothetical protein